MIETAAAQAAGATAGKRAFDIGSALVLILIMFRSGAAPDLNLTRCLVPSFGRFDNFFRGGLHGKTS